MKNRLLNTMKVLAAMLYMSIAAPAYMQAENVSWDGLGEGTAESPYLIGDEAHLRAMADNLTAHYKLTADIDLTSSWTPIGSSYNPFAGTLDGDGYVISNMIITNGEIDVNNTAFVGLWDCIGTDGCVKNLGVKGSIHLESKILVIGGIAGQSQGTITNCYTDVEIWVKGTANGSISVGGIVGSNNSGTINHCYATGHITTRGTASDCYAGGITVFGTASYCYATGSIDNAITSTSKYTGGINAYGNVNHSLALNQSIEETNGDISRISRIGIGSNATFSDNYASPYIPGDWTDKGTDKRNGADLTEANFITSNDAFVDWTNNNNWEFDDVNKYLPQLKTTNGKVIANQRNLPRKAYMTQTEIATADDLKAFRDAVNNGYNYLNVTVRLTADIDLTSVEDWTPIGQPVNLFSGTFDGQGHCISGMKVTQPNTSTNSAFAGLFGRAEGAGSIKNLTVKGSIDISSDQQNLYVGGIAGYGPAITNCYSAVTIKAKATGTGECCVGGIAGTTYNGISDCYATGDIEAQTKYICKVGGILGDGKIKCSYATGAVSVQTTIKGDELAHCGAGGIVGITTQIEHCVALNKSITFSGADYNLSGRITGIIAPDLTGTIASNYASPFIAGGWNHKGTDQADGVDLTTDNFITNANGTDGAFESWGESWDFSTAENLPLLKTDKGTPLAGQDNNAIPRANYLPIAEIATADDLMAFRDIVNNGYDYTGVTVKLTADIDLTSVGDWTPIGLALYRFNGTFDGQGHCISGMKVTKATAYGNDSYTGLFSLTGQAGFIKNLAVKGSIEITEGTESLSAGGIVGNIINISNCYAAVTITVNSTDRNGCDVGGIAGYVSQTVSDCYATGDVTVRVNRTCRVGGITGSGQAKNCYATGAVSGESTTQDSYVGGIAGESKGIYYCLALNKSVTATAQRNVYSGRIVGKGINPNPQLSSNYASPLIEGEWKEVGIDKQDGADLTTANFITNATGTDSAFNGWDTTTNWDFSTTENLPKLNTYNGTPLAGQDDYAEARAGYLFSNKISNAAELKAFCEAVNNGYDYKGQTVTLTADIDLANEGDWTPIGTYDHPFKGTFDGQGHLISGMKVTKGNEGNKYSYAGLFGRTVSGSKIMNVAVEGSIEITYMGTAIYAGGIIGEAGNDIENCYSAVAIKVANTATYTVGGIAGHIGTSVISNCYATGDITVQGGKICYAGGIVGFGNISNCYATGDITARAGEICYAGGIVGFGNVEYCYATGAVSGEAEKLESYVGGISGGSTYIRHSLALNKSITATAGGTLNLGRVAGFMETSSTQHFSNYASPLIEGIWGNIHADLKDGADLTTDNFITRGSGAISAFSGWDTSWDFSTAENLPKLKTNKGTLLAGQEDYADDRANYLYLRKISTADDLKAFRDIVNNGYDYAGKTVTLTKDIDLTNEGEWTPIGTNSNPFKGTFDGQGHLISGMKVTNGNEGNNSPFVGLFGRTVSGSKIMNVAVKGSIDVTYDGDNIYAGGIVGNASNDIENCYSAVTIKVVNTGMCTIGGIAGYIIGTSIISNCYATGDITAQAKTTCYAGGIVGDGKAEYCYATGAVSVQAETENSLVGGIAGYSTCIQHSLALNKSVTATAGGTLNLGRIVGSILSGTQPASNYASPLIAGDWKEVGADRKDGATLTTDNFITNATGTNSAFSGWDESWDFSTTENLPKLKTDKGTTLAGQDDYAEARANYLPLTEISNADELIAFANSVNNGYNYYDQTVTLTADIDLTGKGDWMPIGNWSHPFSGSFDGQGHLIRGMKVTKGNEDNNNSYAGLFGVVNGKSIMNVAVEGSIDITYAGNTLYAGGIAGYAQVEICNCYSDVAITVTNTTGICYTGGIAGEINICTISNCYATGDITARAGQICFAGGIAGNGDVEYSYATGAVSGQSETANSYVGGIAGNSIHMQYNLALNKSVTATANYELYLGRIVGNISNGNPPASNYASPLIVGDWEEAGADRKDGATLTYADFIANADQQDATTFDGWGDSWDLSEKNNLPVLKYKKADNTFADWQSATKQPAITRQSVMRISSIENANELRAFAQSVNYGDSYQGVGILLTGNIDLEEQPWTPIGNYNKPFEGIFSGQGHLISGMKVTKGNVDPIDNTCYAGLFGCAIASANIQNLAVKGSVEISTEHSVYAGGIAGQADRINNCFADVDVHITSKGICRAGGIVGLSENASNSTVTNCYAAGDITAIAEDAHAGGISSACKALYCYATGAVSARGTFTAACAGGILGNNYVANHCLALNSSIIASSDPTPDLARIISADEETLSANYASPLIKGDWTEMTADGKDGATLTEDNFINNSIDEGGAFYGWDSNTSWDLGDGTRLPVLKTNGLSGGNVPLEGQDIKPERIKYLTKTVEITTAVSYDAQEHASNRLLIKGPDGHLTISAFDDAPLEVTVADGGRLTVDAPDVVLPSLILEEGGQVFAKKAFTCGKIETELTLQNRWTAYGSGQIMNFTTDTDWTIYRMDGYLNAENQAWNEATTTKKGPSDKASIGDACLLATEGEQTFKLCNNTLNSPTAAIPADADANLQTGASLHTGQFLFRANPTLHDVKIPLAYILNDEGTRFELQKPAIVKPFRSYMIANEVTTASVRSLAVAANIPTSNRQPALPDASFRLWAANGQLHLSSDRPTEVYVYNTAGQCLHQLSLDGEQRVPLARGIYLVRCNGVTYKVVM